MNDTVSLVNEISINLANVCDRIARAADRAVRPPDEVELIAVTKGFPLETAVAAAQAGLTDLGENRVQEAERKITAWPAGMERPTWHLIGHLQTNKAKRACSLFDRIHSVGSVRLAEEISRRAENMGVRARCLLEVNVAGEASKQGFSPLEIERSAAEIATLPMVEWHGLMTVAPLTDPESNRMVFRQLAQLKDLLAVSFADHPWSQLSMGMTNDFEVAIEEGATAVRIGRAIFGERVY